MNRNNLKTIKRFRTSRITKFSLFNPERFPNRTHIFNPHSIRKLPPPEYSTFHKSQKKHIQKKTVQSCFDNERVQPNNEHPRTMAPKPSDSAAEKPQTHTHTFENTHTKLLKTHQKNVIRTGCKYNRTING